MLRVCGVQSCPSMNIWTLHPSKIQIEKYFSLIIVSIGPFFEYFMKISIVFPGKTIISSAHGSIMTVRSEALLFSNVNFWVRPSINNLQRYILEGPRVEPRECEKGSD